MPKESPQPSKSPKEYMGLRLPPALLKDWRAALLATGRVPRGSPAGLRSDAQLRLMIESSREDLRALWGMFTQERAKIPSYLKDGPRQAQAYTLGFHMPNVARLWHALSQANQRFMLQDQIKSSYQRLRILDLGAGSGAMTQALSRFFRVETQNIEAVLVDKSRTLLEFAEAILRPSGIGRLKSLRSPLEEFKFSGRDFDHNPAVLNILSLGYVLNECQSSPRAMNTIKHALEQLKDKKALVCVVEPASEAHSRAAMAFRDLCVELGFKTLYPCPHSLPCPMLERSRDWCYSEFKWDMPKDLLFLDKVLGVNHAYSYASCFIWASPGSFEGPDRLDKAVLVGRPQESRTRTSALLCEPQGVLSKKDLREKVLRGQLFSPSP